MKTALNFILVICVCVASFFLCAMEGCDTKDTVLEDPVGFQEAIPPSGSEIEPNATIIARFNAPPLDLHVSGGTFSISGGKVTIAGPFPIGSLNLTVSWRDGTIPLSYTVKVPVPDETITVSDRQTMVLIPAGAFTMGTNTPGPEENWLDEGPTHIVHVDAFYMDTHEITNSNFKTFTLAHPEWEKGNIPDALHHGFYLAHWHGNTYPVRKADHPVTYVTWHAAMAYAQWAGKRLPTEAEWEKASRGGLVGKLYPWGDTISLDDANYNFHRGDTREVGKYRPNAYGLYDIAGNVWEWCLDAADPNFYAQTPLKNPLAGVTGNMLANLPELTTTFMDIETVRVLRGGSHYSPPEDLRVTIRGGQPPHHALGSVGFRCVKEVPP